MATPSAQITEKVREVARKVRGQPTSDGAGVRMTRVIGSQVLDSFDPFLLLDEFRSDDPNDYIGGFPDHPHRGFETVTYMLAGRMRHGDNQGNSGLLGPGSIQWMTAGRGRLTHSWKPHISPSCCSGNSECTMPRPAVIHWMLPGPSKPLLPWLSP